MNKLSKINRFLTSFSSQHSNVCYKYSARFLATTNSAEVKDQNYDIAIIGGGIVGLATARKLALAYPNYKFILVEKESHLAGHQTGHNSGVVHAGIYYTPGSLKAKLCVQGLHATYKYCDEHNIPYKKVGKLIVAVNEEQNSRIEGLYNRGLQNSVPDLRLLNANEIKEVEPNCTGLRAIHSPHTGIIDWGYVARHFGMIYEKHGGKIVLNFQADRFEPSTNPEYPIRVSSTQNVGFNAKYMIACGGLYSDKLAQKTGCPEYPKIVPFRGDYLVLKPERTNLVKGNIYPVPDPKFPFLGVHFTPRMDGSVWLGPNAILSLKREGYGRFDFDLKDTLEELGNMGLMKLIIKNVLNGTGISEVYRGLSMAATVKDLQNFYALNLICNERGPSGVRAQAMDYEGNLVDDFVFDSGVGELGKRMLHVRNAPSPAATSSLAIAQVINDEIVKRFNLPQNN